MSALDNFTTFMIDILQFTILQFLAQISFPHIIKPYYHTLFKKYILCLLLYDTFLS